MNLAKGALGLLGTVVIAGWVAYSVSAPRNVENAMNQEMASLDGKSINQVVEESKAEAYAVQCEEVKRLADEEWSRSIEQNRPARMETFDAQIERFCQ
ncbi:hypothetical protein KUW15_04690 [Qipengyuania aquimaris]|uniref:hypothetical protein n=1 Tax=Qipengyuania aquimaris TaxID=255984 RepID=UPI001C9860B4|nr:hypothetical protein [Qipengyuania aquimaris]MBY6128005.1 hypothetical protein [Qipengyuania aquimaris]